MIRRLLALMGLPTPPSWFELAAIGISLAAAAGLGWAINGWRLGAEIDAIRAAAAQAQAAHVSDVLRIERVAGARIQQLEVSAYDSLEKSAAVAAENRRLVAAAGGLRDPGRPAACVPAKPAAARPAADPAAAGRLSDEAAGFLLDLAAACDRAAVYAGTGHAYAREIAGGGDGR